MPTQSATAKTAAPVDAFSILGRYAVRAPWLIIWCWITAVIALTLTVPSLTKVVETQPLKPLPPEAMAASEQMARDFGESANNVLIIVLTNHDGLQPLDENIYRNLAATLRGVTSDVAGVQDMTSKPLSVRL